MDNSVEKRRILLVEDSALVLMGLEQMVQDLGWQVVGPATRLAKALQLAKTEVIHAAILDINLNGEMSYEVAEILVSRQIPVVFSTGYDSSTRLPPNLAGLVVLGKPYEPAKLKQFLASVSSAT